MDYLLHVKSRKAKGTIERIANHTHDFDVIIKNKRCD